MYNDRQNLLNLDEREECLCVPTDSLDDLQFYPNFTDEPISWSDLEIDPDNQKIVSEDFTQNPLPKFVFSDGFGAKRKKRSKRSVSGEMWFKRPFLSREKRVDRRRCSHCAVEKTPQWRIGPLGPKSLCNACGMRFRSGRLVPQYRPAASPCFDFHKHSNYHKKIVRGLVG